MTNKPLPKTFTNLAAMYEYGAMNDMDVEYRSNRYGDAQGDKILSAYAFNGHRMKYLFDIDDNFVRTDCI